MLIDTTLREGAQLFGAYFNVETRKRIADGLIEMGVDEIEMGWVGQEGIHEFAGYLSRAANGTHLSVWSPCREKDILAAAELPVDRINIGVPVSDLHIEKRLDTDRQSMLRKLAAAIHTAREAGFKYISVGLEDISRADPDFSMSMALHAEVCGASRVRLSDSLGQLTPLAMAELVARFRSRIKIDIAVHCHDDFGMATANSVTALDSGADYADVSVMGIGERSGIAATEELVAHLSIRGGRDSYSTEVLKDVCLFVSSAARVPVSRTKAVVGTDIFACESGLHTHALSKLPELFEPYNPESVGTSRKVAVGGKSGRAAVRSALSECGVDSAGADIASLTEAVRQLSCRLSRPLTRSELIRLSSGEVLS
ncbi:pyruvate carboxyltransferase [Maridesulfovibrio sp.]|uniref:homocitrate synthase/isopropylmalate synthase family protein n=1 Tax=Maridesulfovibrio sp. TaxID=2795000 RepID=UPI002A187CC5|nr:pyruvate carboxyltransferase [Maridesulfovibrio sp.]